MKGAEFRHTPGPWEAGIEAYGMNMGGDHRVACDVRAGSRVIARLGGANVKTDPENIYNTHLIAAAPEMYNVLGWLARRAHWPGYADALNPIIHQIESAMAKARGEDLK